MTEQKTDIARVLAETIKTPKHLKAFQEKLTPDQFEKVVLVLPRAATVSATEGVRYYAKVSERKGVVQAVELTREDGEFSVKLVDNKLKLARIDANALVSNLAAADKLVARQEQYEQDVAMLKQAFQKDVDVILAEVASTPATTTITPAAPEAEGANGADEEGAEAPEQQAEPPAIRT